MTKLAVDAERRVIFLEFAKAKAREMQLLQRDRVTTTKAGKVTKARAIGKVAKAAEEKGIGKTAGSDSLEKAAKATGKELAMFAAVRRTRALHAQNDGNSQQQPWTLELLMWHRGNSSKM